MGREIDRLNIKNEEYKMEVSIMRLKLSDVISLEKRNQEMMGLMVVLFAEIESLRKRVEETES